MKKQILALSVALLTVLASGCIQMHMSSVIEKDGSGTLEMTISLSQVVTESMEELRAMDLAEEMDGLDMINDTTREELEEKLKGHDVKITVFEKSVVDGRQTFHLAMEFKDLESMSFAMRELSDNEGGYAVIDNGDGNFVLRSHDYGWPPKPEEEEVVTETEAPQMDPAQMGKQMEIMGKMMSAMAELEISMAITVPGDIISSNAPRVEGRTSTWTIDQSNMMSAEQNMDPEIVFSAKGLKLKAIKE